MSDQAARKARRDPPAVEVRAVSRRYGQRWVLRGVTLTVAHGEVLALTGRNGSGKTTLLRIISTLVRPTRGAVLIDGVDAHADPDRVRGRLGYLAHNAGIYDDLTALENLTFAQRMNGGAPNVAACAAVLERVELTAAANERVRGFSAGMRRRLALARILLRPPTLLLLDEPYASFDAPGISLVNDVVRETASRSGSVIIATHDLERAAAVTDARVDIQEGLAIEVSDSFALQAHA